MTGSFPAPGKPAPKDPYNFKWYMSLTYDDWKRSASWIIKKMQKDHQAGKLSDAQVEAIMKQHDKVYDAAMAKSANWQKIQAAQGVPGDWGSATAPPDLTFWGKIWDAVPVIPGVGDAAAGVKNAVGTVASAKGWIIGGGIFVFIILILGRK